MSFAVDILEAKVFTRKKPSSKTEGDISYGYTVSRRLLTFGAGGCVVVKRKTVMAAGAAEGISETVMRGCVMGAKDAVAVIGFEETPLTDDILKVLSENKGKALAVERKGVKIKDMKSFVNTADALGLIFLAFDGDRFYNERLFEI